MLIAEIREKNREKQALLRAEALRKENKVLSIVMGNNLALGEIFYDDIFTSTIGTRMSPKKLVDFLINFSMKYGVPREIVYAVRGYGKMKKPFIPMEKSFLDFCRYHKIKTKKFNAELLHKASVEDCYSFKGDFELLAMCILREYKENKKKDKNKC